MENEQKYCLLHYLLVLNVFCLLMSQSNHLDIEARKQVGEYLQRKKGFILVSHDRELLDKCIDHILSINRNNIEVQQGNFSTWWNNKQMQDKFELAENEKLRKDIIRLSELARRSANWSVKWKKRKGTRNSGLKLDKGFVGHKAAKMMKRAKSQENRMHSAIEMKSGLLKNIEQTSSLKISPLSYSKRTLITASSLALYYGDVRICNEINFQLHPGERIAVTGRNGCGKSTLLKLIYGENTNIPELWIFDSKLKISYVSQDTSDLKGSLTAYAEQYMIDESLLKAILRKGF